MLKAKEILDRIYTVRNTQQITQAMKMVAGAKLGKAKKKVVALLPYARQLMQIFECVAFDQGGSLSNYFIQRNIRQVLIIFVTTDKGFCGALNNHILQKTMDCYQQYLAQGKQVALLPIGKKGATFLEKKGLPYIIEYTHLGGDISLAQTKDLSKFIMAGFSKKQYDKIIRIHQPRAAGTTQNVNAEQILPVLPSTLGKNISLDFIYEPSQKQIIDYILPKVVNLQLYEMLLSASVAEHTARMIAMSKATENADTLLKDLRLIYNRTRQAAVTKQIIEIAAGAEALR